MGRPSLSLSVCLYVSLNAFVGLAVSETGGRRVTWAIAEQMNTPPTCMNPIRLPQGALESATDEFFM